MPLVVFPIGAYRKEFAADHLDRLLGKSILDRLVHQGSVAEHGHAGGTDQPQHRRDGRGKDAQRHGDDEQSGVELRGRRAEDTDVEIAAAKLTDAVQTAGDEDDDKEQEGVGEQAVDAEHDKDGRIVAGEVGQVVVNAALDLCKICRLGQALQVEELGDGPEVGEARADRLGADAVEAVAEARGERVKRYLDRSHCAMDNVMQRARK